MLQIVVMFILLVACRLWVNVCLCEYTESQISRMCTHACQIKLILILIKILCSSLLTYIVLNTFNNLKNGLTLLVFSFSFVLFVKHLLTAVLKGAIQMTLSLLL